MTTKPERVLIVEDNQDLAFGLKTNMEVQGYEVTLVNPKYSFQEDGIRIYPHLAGTKAAKWLETIEG